MASMFEMTNTRHELPGTHDEVVGQMTALQWEVTEETETFTALQHPLISGTTRIITKE